MKYVNIGEINYDYWYLDGNTLYWTTTKLDFKTEGCYASSVRAIWIKDDYIGFRIGDEEHCDGKFEIFKLENKLKDEEFDSLW